MGLKNSNVASIITDLFIVAIKNNNIFIQLKDENNSIIYPQDLPTLSRIDSILKNKNICETDSINDEIHKKIDAIVYKYLDFSTDEQKYIENQLVEAVKRRTEKSKTSGKC